MMPSEEELFDLIDPAESIRHPEIRVALLGRDGNAFSILGQMMLALKRAGVSEEEREEFMAEATGGSYDDLLACCTRWVWVI